jgi:hypothetical protein
MTTAQRKTVIPIRGHHEDRYSQERLLRDGSVKLPEQEMQEMLAILAGEHAITELLHP